jgi:glutamate--cysteine ligase
MSSPSAAAETPITDRRQLVEALESGNKHRELWRIGTEHEKFGFRLDGLHPALRTEQRHRAMLRADGGVRLGADPRGAPDRPDKRDGGSVSLEPAGQFELSGAAGSPCTRPAARSTPSESRCGGGRTAGTRLRSAWASSPAGDARGDAVDAQGPLRDHAPLHAARGLAGPGHDDPHLHRPGEPRLRRRGRHGEKFRVSLALQPLATALFADSPFTEGKPNGYLARCAAHLDRHRSRPHRHARLRGLRGRLRLRALSSTTCSTCRCTSSMRDGHVDAPASRSAKFLEGRLDEAARPAGDDARLGRTT